MALPFDRVELGTGDQRRVLNPWEYLAIPLSERVRALMEGGVVFKRGEETVDSSLALKAITAVFRR